MGVDFDPKNKEKITNLTKEYFDALHPRSSRGAYVNFIMEEGQERVKASFRDNYDRLATIQKKYDPTNFFRVNQNIGRQRRSDFENLGKADAQHLLAASIAKGSRRLAMS